MWKSSKTTVTGPSGKKKKIKDFLACVEYLITHQSREAFSDTASDGAWQIVDLLAELLGCAGYCKILVKLVTIHLEFSGEVVGNVIAEKRKSQTMNDCCMIYKSDIVSRDFLSSIIFMRFRFFNIFWTVKSMHVVSFILKVQTFIFATDSKLHLKIHSKFISKLGFINESNGHV